MNNRVIAATIALLMGLGNTICAQEDKTDLADVFTTTGKVLKKTEKFGIAQLTVSYKLTSTESIVSKERKTGKMAGAHLTAYLETTDGELTNADFQEVTDYFYSYFQKKLKASGVDTVAWNSIAATDFYKNADEKKVSNEEQGGDKQVWETYNAHNGNILYGGFALFAFGKIKKASHFCEEIGGTAGFFYVTVDFADIIVDMKISTDDVGYPSGYYPYRVTTRYKYHSATKPDMKILPTEELSIVWNEKQQGQAVTLTKELQTNTAYHTSVTQDQSRLKNKAFAFEKSMEPVVIETTREKYKAAAKIAVERYADAFVAKLKDERE